MYFFHSSVRRHEVFDYIFYKNRRKHTKKEPKDHKFCFFLLGGGGGLGGDEVICSAMKMEKSCKAR